MNTEINDKEVKRRLHNLEVLKGNIPGPLIAPEGLLEGVMAPSNSNPSSLVEDLLSEL